MLSTISTSAYFPSLYDWVRGQGVEEAWVQDNKLRTEDTMDSRGRSTLTHSLSAPCVTPQIAPCLWGQGCIFFTQWPAGVYNLTHLLSAPCVTSPIAPQPSQTLPTSLELNSKIKSGSKYHFKGGGWGTKEERRGLGFGLVAAHQIN